MRKTRILVAVLAVAALTGGGSALAAFAGHAKDTNADYTPFEKFTPLPASAACTEALNDSFELPEGYGQQVVAQELDGGSVDLWDMNTQNESGKDAGRYVYRTHEVGSPPGSQVTVTDLTDGETTILAQRLDWERFDGIVWTPWGTILAAEETDGRPPYAPDPNVPEAKAGLVYEFFVDPSDPSTLKLNDPRDDVAPFDDGVAVRPALGSKSHEGMRFDRRGYHYGIAESNPGGIYRFVPDKKGDLSSGDLQVYKSANGRDGEGVWVSIPDAQARINAQTAANTLGANAYSRPEDVETGESTGRDRNNGGNTLYVAITGTDEVFAIDLSNPNRPYGYQYVFTTALGMTTAPPNASDGEFESADNLALDRKGNLVITEDPGGVPPKKTKGDDLWIAAPSSWWFGSPRRPAATVQRFASMKDCIAEPTGVYFALKGTEEFTEDGPFEELVNDESLFVNRQHAGQGTILDQFVSIAPLEDDNHDDEEDEDDGDDDEDE